MNERANVLADRIEQGAKALAAYVEDISDVEWATVVPNEKRTVGVLVHHVASSYQVEVDLASLLASGKPIKGVTWDVIDGINDDHAREYAQVNKKDVVKLLLANGKTAADRVKTLTDAELDRAAAVSLNSNAPLTAQFFIEDHALRHSFSHLDSIRKTLGG